MVTVSSMSTPFHILPSKKRCPNPSICVVPKPCIHLKAILSLAPFGVALTISHSTGQGLSTLSILSVSRASETVMPVCTKLAASFLFSCVTKLRVPISSSGPQRPQLLKVSFHSSNCTCETNGETCWAFAPESILRLRIDTEVINSDAKRISLEVCTI